MKKIFCLILILFLGAIMNSENKSEEKKPILKTITTKEAYKLIRENKNNKNFVIIDVRTDAEFKEGHIENAINMDYYGGDVFEKNLNQLDKNKSYAIYCRSGHRSGLAFKIMEKLGFNEVYNFGALTDWISAGYKIVK
jgi:rhodanese-related sulfurtransferase